ncbi:hypothetical protein FB451DRAFT_1375446 [Mycena latifolia]|nr:hypothetical protein FB451DRAFT_1375446 [Mycena latifolia]
MAERITVRQSGRAGTGLECAQRSTIETASIGREAFAGKTARARVRLGSKKTRGLRYGGVLRKAHVRAAMAVRAAQSLDTARYVPVRQVEIREAREQGDSGLRTRDAPGRDSGIPHRAPLRGCRRVAATAYGWHRGLRCSIMNVAVGRRALARSAAVQRRLAEGRARFVRSVNARAGDRGRANRHGKDIVCVHQEGHAVCVTEEFRRRAQRSTSRSRGRLRTHARPRQRRGADVKALNRPRTGRTQGLSAMRHASSWVAADDVDPDSGGTSRRGRRHVDEKRISPTQTRQKVSCQYHGSSGTVGWMRETQLRLAFSEQAAEGALPGSGRFDCSFPCTPRPLLSSVASRTVLGSDRFVEGTPPVLIQNAKILTGARNGTEIVFGDILLDKGLVLGVGYIPQPLTLLVPASHRCQRKMDLPWNRRCAFAPGGVLCPALNGALDMNSIKTPILPWLRSIDGLNTHDDAYKLAIAGGVTTAQIVPGSANNIGARPSFVLFSSNLLIPNSGGQAFLAKLRPTAERSASAMILEPPLTLSLNNSDTRPKYRHMKHACGENPSRVYGQTRMDSCWEFRRAYNEARKIKEAQDSFCAAAEQGLWDGKTPFPESLQWEALVDVLRGRVKVVDLDALMRVRPAFPVFFIVFRRIIIQLSNEFKFPIASIHHAAETYLVPDLLKEAWARIPFHYIHSSRRFPRHCTLCVELPETNHTRKPATCLSSNQYLQLCLDVGFREGMGPLRMCQPKRSDHLFLFGHDRFRSHSTAQATPIRVDNLWLADGTLLVIRAENKIFSTVSLDG